MARLKVLFWDIDGTLIRAGGAGKLAWLRALQDLYAVDASDHEISWSGQTDPSVSASIATKLGLPGGEVELDRFFTRYSELLPQALQETTGEILPGIHQLLTYIQQRGDLQQGLLTGNIRRGAELKLNHYGLWHYFSLGGFADGLFERPQIAKQALENARGSWGSHLKGEEILVIGDTPFDIECGRFIGAQTLAVGTGFSSWERLEESGPDFQYRDLGDYQRILQDLGL